MESFSKRLKKALELTQTKQADIVKATGISKSAISQYVSGTCEPKQRNTFSIAKALGVSEAWLMGYDVQMLPEQSTPSFVAPNIYYPPDTTKKPILETIACDSPILTVKNYKSFVNVPNNIHVDFCLLCKGDSMINSRINNGDIVYIQEQSYVENGEIAAVIIGNEATLKRVYTSEDHITLIQDNPKYPPLVYYNNMLNKIRIIGKAVAFTSKIL